MFQVKVHKHIERITEVFYRIGFWHRQDEETVTEWRLKLFYSIYFFLYPLSLMAGAFASDNQDEFLFLAEMAILTAVELVKLLYVIWRKRGTLELINLVCDYGVEDQETFTLINQKLKTLMKFVAVFFGLCYFCLICAVLVIPFLGTEKKLFMNIGFPLDYKNNDFAFWMAFAFLLTHITIASIALLCTVIVWYLVANCGLRYVVLGQQIKVMGERKPVEGIPERKISNAEQNNLYGRDLIEAITSHQYLEELTKQLGSFLSNVFVDQFITSGFCICTSIYSLAFNRGDNMLEFFINLAILLYTIFDIFMVLYLGNEIKLTSDRLSYSLFESNWVDRSQAIKKNVLIFSEFLMKPRQLVVLKLYPLTLETFTRILNSAYSMFNILKNLK